MEYFSSLDSRELDKDVPTLFEIISNRQLDALLAPSVRYVLVYYTTKYPQYLLRIVNNFDELNLVIKSAIEYYNLTINNGCFTEKFYGIKRANNLPVKFRSKLNNDLIEARRRLTKLQIAVSIVDFVGISYISDKCELLFARYTTESILRKLDAANYPNKLKKLFLRLYPMVDGFFKAVNLGLQLLYIAGKIQSPNLLCWLFNVKYARLNEYDYKLEELRNNPVKFSSSATRIRPPSAGESILGAVRRFTTPLNKSLLFTVGKVFPIAIFLLKFLEWWSTSEFAAKLANSDNLSIELPPPSGVVKTHESAAKPSTTTSGECPICKKPITNPTILETGHVFDYKCIHEYLSNQPEEKGCRCPVTGKRLLNVEYNKELEMWIVNDSMRKLII